MTSQQTTAMDAARSGNIRQAYSGSAAYQERYSAVDEVTTGASETANNVVQLFGPGLNMEGCCIDPESIRIRTGGTAGTISYVGKLQRVDAAGTVVDITGNITLNRTIPTVAAAAVTPQVPLAKGETIRLILTTVTTHVAGVIWSIEMPFRRRRAPGMA